MPPPATHVCNSLHARVGLSLFLFLVPSALCPPLFGQSYSSERFVGAEELIVHEHPWKGSTELARLEEGNEVTVEDISATGDWLEVRTGSGVDGWVDRGCMRPNGGDSGVGSGVALGVLLVGATVGLFVWQRMDRARKTGMDPLASILTKKLRRIAALAGTLSIMVGVNSPALSFSQAPMTLLEACRSDEIGGGWFEVAVAALGAASLYALVRGVGYSSMRAFRWGGTVALLMALVAFGECYYNVDSVRETPSIRSGVLVCDPAAVASFHSAQLGWGLTAVMVGAFLTAASGLIGSDE